jgi:hypothetical protein
VQLQKARYEIGDLEKERVELNELVSKMEG